MTDTIEEAIDELLRAQGHLSDGSCPNAYHRINDALTLLRSASPRPDVVQAAREVFECRRSGFGSNYFKAIDALEAALATEREYEVRWITRQKETMRVGGTLWDKEPMAKDGWEVVRVFVELPRPTTEPTLEEAAARSMNLMRSLVKNWNNHTVDELGEAADALESALRAKGGRT